MKLHNLSNTYKRKSRKRVGRGDSSGLGRCSGRGDKGAGARSGYSRRYHFEGGQIPLMRRLPKRGFNNPNHAVYSIVNVGQLEKIFAAGNEVDEQSLAQKGVIVKGNAGLKVLGDGDLTLSLTVKAKKFSASARQKIESAGGSCQEI